ncbi:uncharacterized protein METZ01_LOCUS196945, partial [marine metagenome]
LAVFGTFESMCFYHCGTGGRRLL